ncbi:MAG: alanine--tRNA ligase [Verrucomicrobiota bacterium]|nr:MAG: alanine--tRNA ligase [Verrucomicrobiota bacterium]
MNSAEIRKSFLDFFASKGHQVVPSSSLLPESPNLLFTNAGMNQFVPIFLGERVRPYKRAADTQKCIRAGGKHNDLEDVGFDTYHHTFFEMLGNWSFGDYFKKDAIHWAWELLTHRWGFPKERLYITVYRPGPGEPASFDQEAYDEWEAICRQEGLDPDIHILSFGKKENFWMMGDMGPCGPCSEIHMDLTPEGDTRGTLVNRDSPLCIEIWNLVFMQFNALGNGEFSDLAAQNVDTGMGLERVAGIFKTTKNFTDFSQKPSNYDSDLFDYIFQKIAQLSGTTYHGMVAKDRQKMSEQEKIDFAYRVIADHIRALTFSIADGILPGNEGRHYVLRRILRRAVIFAKKINLPVGSFAQLAECVIEKMSPVFSELSICREIVLKTITTEETMFEKTLHRGMALLEERLGQTHSKMIRGSDAFLLYDTYGFPLDLTQLIAQERGFAVDEVGFQEALEAQRERARNAQKKSKIAVSETSSETTTKFVGYTQMEGVAAKIQQIIRQEEGVLVMTDCTPFYGEMGGEIGDTGTIVCNGKTIPVIDALRDAQGNILHKVVDAEGLLVGDEVTLNIDVVRRREIQRHHTATHLLHAALRHILGDHVKQSGSFVGDHGLRFDFNYFVALKPEELTAVEAFVNQRILDNIPVTSEEKPFDAIPKNCIAHFREKYGERVRVLSIGDQSVELCGGCHAAATGELGIFKIVKESAIAAGIRRIEAVVGHSAITYLNHKLKTLALVGQKLSVSDGEIPQKLQQIQDERKSQERRLASVLQVQNQKTLEEVFQNAQQRKDLTWITGCFEVVSAKDLKSLIHTTVPRSDVAIFIGNLAQGSLAMVHCSPKAIAQGYKASALIDSWTQRLTGKGGGSDHFGTASFEKRLLTEDITIPAL